MLFVLAHTLPPASGSIQAPTPVLIADSAPVLIGASAPARSFASHWADSLASASASVLTSPKNLTQPTATDRNFAGVPISLTAPNGSAPNSTESSAQNDLTVATIQPQNGTKSTESPSAATPNITTTVITTTASLTVKTIATTRTSLPSTTRLFTTEENLLSTPQDISILPDTTTSNETIEASTTAPSTTTVNLDDYEWEYTEDAGVKSKITFWMVGFIGLAGWITI